MEDNKKEITVVEVFKKLEDVENQNAIITHNIVFMRIGKNFSLNEVYIPQMLWYDKTIETSKPNSKGE